jgi:predicted NAD-dependent protein-ADP-ribosyltransferase YbiA (DUF1768 family)
MARFFVSYSHQDRPLVDQVIRTLDEAGIQFWIDTADIPAGSNWQQQIEMALRAADAIIAVISPASVQSQSVQRELLIATAMERPLFPVFVQGDDWLSIAPTAVLDLPYVDVRGNAFNRGIRKLIEALRDFSQTEQRQGVVPASRIADLLVNEGFSSSYVSMYDRLLNRRIGRADDYLVLHLSETISLSDAGSLEKKLDGLFRNAIQTTPRFERTLRFSRRDFEASEPVVRVRSFVHPGSTELYLAAAATTTILQDPIVRDLLLNVVASAMWDAIRKIGQHFLRFGARKTEGAQVEVLLDAQTGALSENIQMTGELLSYAEETVVEMNETHRYWGFKSGRFVVGVERRTTTRRYTREFLART